MKLQTIVDIKPSSWQIGYEDKILLTGSCFADSIGQIMTQRGLAVTCNPFGTLYNPLSIAKAMQMKEVPQLIERDGLWHSMAHHGSFSRSTKEETKAAVETSINIMQQTLSKASVIIVTFGTAWVYEMHGEVVGNCHKMPEEMFTRRRLSADEIVQTWSPIIAQHPEKHWLFTVSPIRHIRDGLHENQLSKATLLEAVEKLAVTYFPSYEILLDELRDYRFYADDLVHPSPLAVNYIWERFIEAYCSPQTRNEMNIRLKKWKFEQHIPLH